MVGYILKRSLEVLFKKPILLWGISLLYGLIVSIINLLGGTVMLITIPITLTLSAGMSALYLAGYTGGEVSSKRLFDGFASGNLKHVMGGMCWHKLWSVIWAFVPIAGIVKAYSYRFTPYILLTRPETGALDALKKSMEETKGVKLSMFLTDLLIWAAAIAAIVVLGLLALIPYIGILFLIIEILFVIAVIMFLPVIMGIISAAFYEETRKGSLKQISQFASSFTADAGTDDAPNRDWECSGCGTINAAHTKYCRACGKRHDA